MRTIGGRFQPVYSNVPPSKLRTNSGKTSRLANKLKIDVISDIHLNRFFKSKMNDDNTGLEDFTEANIVDFWRKLKPNKDSSVLVIAGDISVDIDESIEFLKLIKKHFTYKNIVMVFGNHEYRVLKDSHSSSKAKIRELRDRLAEFPWMNVLNGPNVVNISGVKFAGADSWCDGSFILRHGFDIAGKTKSLGSKK